MIIGDLVRCFFFQKSIVTVSNGSQDAFSSKKKVPTRYWQWWSEYNL
jgi:hypothetical protein